MIDKLIDRWIRWRYYRWEVRIAEQWEQRLAVSCAGDDRFDVFGE
jgi:hypothetical protein